MPRLTISPIITVARRIGVSPNTIRKLGTGFQEIGDIKDRPFSGINVCVMNLCEKEQILPS